MKPSTPRRKMLLGALLLIAMLLALGLWLLFSGTNEHARVETAVNDLVIAVETENVARVGAGIHENYTGWMVDKAAGLAAFEAALPRIESLNIRLRHLEVELNEGETEAVVKLEWTYTMIFSAGDLGKVDTSRILEDAWAPATLRLVREGDGPWLLIGSETDLPQFRPRRITGQ